jgi:uncharacterized membrane protein
MKKLLLYVLSIFYILAGMNHFWNPAFYEPLIPPYLPNHQLINIASGVAEIILGAGVFFPATRKLACTGIIILLILFIPSHIHFIVIGGCADNGLCVPVWVAWVRLIVVHPILIYWAFSYRTANYKHAISN